MSQLIREINNQTEHDRHVVNGVWPRMMNDPQVRRFFSMSQYCPPFEYASDWNHVIATAHKGKALLKFGIDRTDNRTAKIGVWVVEDNPVRKRLVAGRLIKYAFEVLAKRYGTVFIEWDVHSTNTNSLAVSTNWATQLCVREESAWDCELGQWVDQHTFRYDLRKEIKCTK